MNEKVISSCALPHHTDNWDTIVWRKVIQRVNRLQRRIAKAVKEGRWGKVKSLIYLVSKSFYAKLLAVFRVTTNKGGHTPGVDNIVWLNAYKKLQAAHNLKTRGYAPKPLRRVYIRKKNGKKRPLSIPCMHDRAMQTLFVIALNPIAETTADPNSMDLGKEGRVQMLLPNVSRLYARKGLPYGSLKQILNPASMKSVTIGLWKIFL